MKTFYITTPIYYINGMPHIGHAYTTVSADILARYWRMKLGADAVYFLTGTDEHGAKIAQKAYAEKKDPQVFADEMSAAFQVAWDRLLISNNDFIRTTQDRHTTVVIDLLQRLKEATTPLGNPALYEGAYEGLYCVGCEGYKKESDLNLEGLCPDHLKRPELVTEMNWFFRLSDFTETLKKMLVDGIYTIQPESAQNEILSLLEQGLEDLAISRQTVEWGIELPWDKSQTVYVWVEALMNYVSALGGLNGELYVKFWPAQCHLMSKDIIKFHAVIWPALLIGLGSPVPHTVYAHGYFTIDGQKMSKTLGNVIDPNELVDAYGADATRYLLVSQFGFGTDGDIARERFDDMYNAHLAGGFGNLVARVAAMTSKYADGVVPNGVIDDALNMTGAWKAYHKAMEAYHIDEALKVARECIDKANQYLEEHKPWERAKTDLTDAQVSLHTVLEAVRHIALMLWPYMPDVADKTFEILGYEPTAYKKAGFETLMVWGGIAAGNTVKQGIYLFPRIEK